MKKIDAHLHVAQIIAGYCRRGELRAAGQGKAIWGNGELFQLIPQEYGDKSFTIESAIGIMQQNNVEKAVLMQGSMYGFQNQYHYEIIKKYPGMFCPSCTVDPYMTNCLDTLRYYFSEMGFRLAKFEVSSGGGLMGCHEPFSLMSERMQEIYQVISDHDGILALDVGDITMASYQPENLRQLALRFPGLKLVVCHLLAPVKGREKEWMEDLKRLHLDNVWFDISALPKILDSPTYPFTDAGEILTTANDILGSKKMMWGTDAPFAVTRNSYQDLAEYLEAGGVSGSWRSIYTRRVERYVL